MLESTKIILRPIIKSDAPLFYKWRNDISYIELTQSIRFPKHEQLEEEWVDRAIKDTSNKNIVFVMVEKEGNQPIGFIQLSAINWIAKNCMFGIAITESAFHGKGYAAEAMRLLYDYAFTKLNLIKISLEVIESNTNAIKLYEKFGFELEGRLKKQYFWNDTYLDVFIYSLFKEKFMENGNR